MCTVHQLAGHLGPVSESLGRMDWSGLVSVGLTHRDGVDEGSDSQGQAAAQHGEDGIAQVVVDGVCQRALGHIDGWLDGHGGHLPGVLLSIRLLSIRLLSVWRSSILWWGTVALRPYRREEGGKSER